MTGVVEHGAGEAEWAVLGNGEVLEVGGGCWVMGVGKGWDGVEGECEWGLVGLGWGEEWVFREGLGGRRKNQCIGYCGDTLCETLMLVGAR